MFFLAIFFFIFFFFFNDTATTEIYTLSLHDALPIGLHRPLVEGIDPSGRRAIDPPDRRGNGRVRLALPEMRKATRRGRGTRGRPAPCLFDPKNVPPSTNLTRKHERNRCWEPTILTPVGDDEGPQHGGLRSRCLGGALRSHPVAGAVPSAREGFTSGFGRGPGVSPPPWPPKR